jgi:hypothetical protein
VVEMVTTPEWILWVATFLFVGEAPRRFVVGCSPFPRSQLFGAVRRGSPLPDSTVRRFRIRNKVVFLIWSMATALEEQGGGSARSSRFDDFPAARGLLPFQVICGEVAAARRRHGLFFVGVVEFQRDLSVIFFCALDRSVRTVLC